MDGVGIKTYHLGLEWEFVMSLGRSAQVCHLRPLTIYIESTHFFTTSPLAPVST